MKSNFKNVAKFIFFCIIGGLVILFFKKNYKSYDFYNVTFFELVAFIISTTLLIYISIIFTRASDAEKNKKQYFISLIEKIELYLSEEGLYKITNGEEIRKTQMLHRTIINTINVLDKNSKEYQLESEINDLKEKFDRYKTNFDEKIDKISELNALSSSFNRDLLNMKNICMTVLSKLYGFKPL